jgi:hypothetical protein
MDDHAFCRMMLGIVRGDAKAGKVKLPRGLVALRADERQFFVESRDGFRDYVKADCAWHAKALAINELIDKAKPKTEAP